MVPRTLLAINHTGLYLYPLGPSHYCCAAGRLDLISLPTPPSQRSMSPIVKSSRPPPIPSTPLPPIQPFMFFVSCTTNPRNTVCPVLTRLILLSPFINCVLSPTSPTVLLAHIPTFHSFLFFFPSLAPSAKQSKAIPFYNRALARRLVWFGLHWTLLLLRQYLQLLSLLLFILRFLDRPLFLQQSQTRTTPPQTRSTASTRQFPLSLRFIRSP